MTVQELWDECSTRACCPLGLALVRKNTQSPGFPPASDASKLLKISLARAKTIAHLWDVGNKAEAIEEAVKIGIL